MDGPHPHHRPLSGADDWDDRYAGSGRERIWSGEPNGSLRAEIATVAPGRAVDLGCGEGADAVWLASRGWQVTGIDISRVALERAAEAARRSGVLVDWVRADFVEQPPDAGAFDLVATHYPALLRSEADRAIAALLVGVAPHGTLLFVGHEVSDPGLARSHGFDPDDYLQPGDVAARLDSGWTVDTLDTRPRDPAPPGSPHSRDLVLRATRTG